jgi:hypothetical protein
MRRGSEHQGWLTRLRRGSFGLAALFAIALQVFVVQTHVHALGAAHAASAFAQSSSDATAHARDGAAGETQRACIVCQALANAGRMLAPAAAQVLPADAGTAAARAPQIRSVVAAPAHSWQSRAPPIVL